MFVECRNVLKVFGPGAGSKKLRDAAGTTAEGMASAGLFAALADITLGVDKGETLVIMGLSGSGKSTLLRCLTRLIEPTSGEIYFDGQNIMLMERSQLLALRRRHMSMVFQNFALLPNRTVLGNVELPLEIQRTSSGERRKTALEMIELVGLQGKEDHYPHELSGGQQQRVGIARSLSSNPSLWLLDEPFSALDPLIRKEMQDEVIRLKSSLAKTVVFVTHDFDEAARIGDRIAILRNGRLVQCGTAEDLVFSPADDYVRAFTADVDRSRIVRAARFMKPGAVDQVDARLSVAATLKEASQAFGAGAQLIGFFDKNQAIVGSMHRSDLAAALFDATMP
nr:betaine/proline/choline family ABC transporter ATP-binding protein [uncultured Devosia sp.]